MIYYIKRSLIQWGDIMNEKLFANKEILKWARESVHITLAQASSKLNIDVTILKDIEEGKEPISYSNLEKMAKLYGRPIALFFFSRIPEEPTPVKQFRTLPDVAFYEFDPNMYKLFRKALIMQLNVKELNDNISTFNNVQIKLDENNIKKSCELVRTLLEININMQKKKNDIAKSLEMWREAFEKIGISVFKDSFQNDSYSGFCIYDKDFPVILINNNLSKNRQLFTMFHELSHILFRTSGIDIENDENINDNIINYVDKNIEQFCNKFAGEFLVPTDDFLNEYHVLKETDTDIEEICKKLSKLYTVSKEVILRKIVDNNLYSSNIYNILINKWNEELENIPKRKPMGNFYSNKLAYLGKNYVSIVLKNYYNHSINASQASSYLMLKPKNFNEFSNRFRGVM